MRPVDAYLALLGAVALERSAEMVLSARNLRRAKARGGRESGQALYPLMVIFHAALLPALAVAALLRPSPPSPLAWLAVAGVFLAQGLRWWAVASLGDRWNTRVVIVPEPPVTRGPYAVLRHPNYLAVVLEVACLPLAFGLWKLAIAFSLGNALLLWARIRDEERALGPQWERAFSRKRRFVP